MMNMRKQLHLQHSSSVLLIMITLLFTPTLAQSPADITAILKKAGKFNIFIRLLKSTGLGEQINSELKISKEGLTLFVPPDNAFSYLPRGTLNSFTGQQMIELVQFHELTTYVPLIQFQTLSNPLVTKAGNSYDGQFPLNVSTSGLDVHMITGVVNAKVTSTIYTDGKFAVYEVDKVLLPLEFHVSLAPALAPSESKKKSDSSSAPSSSYVLSSIAVRIIRYIGFSFAVAVIAI